MALPYDTDALIKQSQQMLAQTKAEGSKAFAGSAYDTVKAAPLPTPVNTGAINVANLATPATPLNPTTAQPPVYTTPAIPQALVQTEANKSALSGADASLGRIAEYRAQLAGQSSFVEQQKAQQDIIGKQALATQYTNQLNQAKQEAQGIQLQLQTTLQQQQEAARGQGVTAGGLAPHLRASQTTANQALLSNAIKQYGIGASLAAAQGDLTSALDYVDQAVKLQFDPITANLQAELANLDAIKNSSAYTEAEKKRAMALEYQVQQEIAENEEKREEKKSVQNLAIRLAENGVSPEITRAVQSADSFNEALSVASPYMQDPAQKMALESARLDMSLTKARLARENYELALLKKYDGLTPTQYKAALEEQQNAINNAKTEEEQNRLQGEAINEKIVLLDSLLESNAIDSVVGANVFARAANSPKGVLGRFIAGAIPGAAAGGAGGALFGGVGAIPGAIGGAVIGGTSASLQGTKDYFTGSADKLVGQTEQFISKEFLQNLIDAKARGATFGALTKTEQDALTAAATFIGQRRVYLGEGEDKVVTGYDMSEADFKREIGRIRSLAQKAYEKSTGKTFTNDEEQVLEAAFSSSSPIISGNLFFQ